jgi:hypothetical protein
MVVDGTGVGGTVVDGMVGGIAAGAAAVGDGAGLVGASPPDLRSVSARPSMAAAHTTRMAVIASCGAGG